MASLYRMTSEQTTYPFWIANLCSVNEVPASFGLLVVRSINRCIWTFAYHFQLAQIMNIFYLTSRLVLFMNISDINTVDELDSLHEWRVAQVV